MSTATVAKTFKLGGDLEVNRLGFGAMRITGEGVWGPPKDPEAARKVLKKAVELGVNFIDTADAYGPDVSEHLIGEALSPYAKGLVIATKGGLTRQGPNKWIPVGQGRVPDATGGDESAVLSRQMRSIYGSCIASIQRCPVEESLGAIKKLQKAGKIKHVGLSEVKPHEIEQARKVIDIVSVQNKYNIGDRAHEDVVEYCDKHGIGFIPWFPVAAGELAKPGGKLDEAAKRHNATVSQLSLAWLLHHSPVILPIPGTSSVEHLEENVKAAEVTLSDSEWKEIEAAAA